MNVALLLVPYDSAQRGARMGAGPERLVEAGLADALARRGNVTIATVESRADAWRAEVATACELASAVADAVRDARASTGP